MRNRKAAEVKADVEARIAQIEQMTLVSVLEVLESDESFVIQGWWPDS